MGIETPHSGWTPILLVVAHPDDETIGAGIQLMRWDPSRVTIVHVTNGSPRDLHDASDHGFKTREDYLHERRRELYAALDIAGIRPDQCIEFKYVDKEAWLNIPEIAGRLMALMEELRPGIVYTHPYEGGHPDHDSVAFAVAQASQVPVMEFTSYHEGPAGLITGQFLGGGETETLEFTEEEKARKRTMLRCFRSQQNVLADFAIDAEKFRPAPKYDFFKPPHSGVLHYEKLGWNISGEEWRKKGAEALQVLETRRSL